MMEIDSPRPSTANEPNDEKKESVSGNEQEKTLKVHPLAIINISDHQTRVTMGGSPLPATSPIIGLLFGYQEGLVIHIIDAIEITAFGINDTEEEQKQHKSSIQTKIDLHQKVFPHHEAIGWYRVSSTDTSPTEEDLFLTHTAMRDYNESPLFLLMTNVSFADDTDGGDNQLPLSIYETLLSVDDNNSNNGGADAHTLSLPSGSTSGCGGGGGTPRAVFCNLSFELDSREPERIAVERVFDTQPRIVSRTTDAESQTTVVRETESGLDLQLRSLTGSMASLNKRVDMLLEYLTAVRNGDVAPDYRLLRMIDGFIKQLPPRKMENWEDEFEKEYRDMLMYSYLAVVTKTAKALQGYSEKFRTVHDGNKREMRRGY